MNRTMTYDEVKLAMRVIGLRGTSMKAKKNQWECRFNKDRAVMNSLIEKGHLTTAPEIKGGWWMKLTPQGIQQLKLQIGEFHF